MNQFADDEVGVDYESESRDITDGRLQRWNLSDHAAQRPKLARIEKETMRCPLLVLQQTSSPSPESFQRTLLDSTARLVIRAVTLLLSTAPSGDLISRPLLRPDDPSALDPVMRLAGLLPVPDRRVERRSTVRLLKSPIGRAKRSPDLRAAGAGTQMRGGFEFQRYVQHAGTEVLRHVTDVLQLNSHRASMRQRSSDRRFRTAGCGVAAPRGKNLATA